MKQTTNNKQQTTNNKQQTTNNKQQTTNNKHFYIFSSFNSLNKFTFVARNILININTILYFRGLSMKNKINEILLIISSVLVVSILFTIWL